MNDSRFLQEYADNGSEQAFSELVKRHANTVYAVCLRRIGDVHLAEDAAQEVFLLLAQKAERLRNRNTLSGWLVQSAVYVSLNIVKVKSHQRKHEEKMGEINKIHSGPEPAEPEWQNLAPFVDSALLNLKDRDRDAVVLRYYQGRSHREIAEILAVSEAAVRKRVSRALDRLKKTLTGQGVVLPAAVIGVLISENAVQAAPPALVENCISMGVKKTGLPIAESAGRFAEGGMKTLMWAKIKLAAAVLAGITVVAGGALLVYRTILKSRPHMPEVRTVDLGSGVKLELVLIPAGEFDMGNPNAIGPVTKDEGPVHRVRLTRPFYMGTYEVTQEQWQRLMGTNPSHWQDPRRPVESISWHDCQEFIRRLNERYAEGLLFRLPTEAEWEYACRAGTETLFHFGETISTNQVNYRGTQFFNNAPPVGTPKKSLPVGSFSPNAWGLYNMHGNVREWCSDWYTADYYARSPLDDPAGPATGMKRILRGGNWGEEASYCRSAARYYYAPSSSLNRWGMRVVAVPRGEDR